MSGGRGPHSGDRDSAILRWAGLPSVQDPSGGRTQQDYDYDAFGNITEVKTWPPGQSSQTTTIQVNPDTNRLSSAGYDGSGNITAWGGNSYAYDTGNSMVKQNNRWYFLYTFSGERVATIDWQGSITTREVDWTIRGPSNQVLSTFKLTGEDQAGNWSREIDYIWMGRRLLGTESFMQMSVENPDGTWSTFTVPDEQLHYHTDHLGTIRLVTDAAGNKVSEHEYLPYGQELTAAGNGVMKFTGHERDPETGMDYMHARFYSSFLGRFNSVDPIVGGAGVLNRYAYVGGNPLGLTDPTGMLPSQSSGCHYSSGAAVIFGALTGSCPAGGGGGYEPTSGEIFDALVNKYSPVELNIHPRDAADVKRYLEENPEEAAEYFAWLESAESRGMSFDPRARAADEWIDVMGGYVSTGPGGCFDAWECIVENNPNEFGAGAEGSAVLTEVVSLSVPGGGVGKGGKLLANLARSKAVVAAASRLSRSKLFGINSRVFGRNSGLNSGYRRLGWSYYEGRWWFSYRRGSDHVDFVPTKPGPRNP